MLQHPKCKPEPLPRRFFKTHPSHFLSTPSTQLMQFLYTLGQIPRPSPGTSQAHLRHLSGKSLAYLVRIPCICQVYLNFILSIFPLHLRNISCITQIYLLQNSDKFHANPLNISQYNPVPCTCYNRKCLVG